MQHRSINTLSNNQALDTASASNISHRPNAGQVALRFEELHLTLGNKSILSNLSGQFNYANLTVLLGPNGTGKSSLLKVITQELANSGKLFLDQRPIQQWSSQSIAKRIGILPQSSSLAFNFSAQEVVELGGIALNCANTEIQQFARQNMQRTDTLHLATRLYPSLSGGEKQRVHFARVLTQLEQSGDKKILLLDEPTAALDLAHQHQTLALAKQLAEQGAAVVIVMHDLNLAAQYADRVMILNEGNIVADGTPWQVLTAHNIEQVYQCKTQVIAHPDLGYPMIISAI